MDLREKVLGGWLGMAIGDALGQSVKGLKPETLRQLFKKVDRYHDVRAHIGKGVRRYRMAGLYGVFTQCAMAMADTILHHRKPDPDVLGDLLMRMATHGPEHYFGVFRRPEGALYRSMQSMAERPVFARAEHASASGITLSLALPLALHQQRSTQTLLKGCVESSLLLSSHPWEAMATALTGCLTVLFLNEPHWFSEEARAPDQQIVLFKKLAQQCEANENWFQEHYPGLWILEERNSAAMSQTFHGLAEMIEKQDSSKIREWICENASKMVKQKIHHPTQGHVLTLLPFALWQVLNGTVNFESGLIDTLNLGREADKLGGLVGCWLGIRYGADSIPEEWKTKLVNAREILLRGGSIARKGKLKGARDLVEMELGLTQKEAEERKRYLDREPSGKRVSKPGPPDDLWMEEEPEGFARIKEDPYKLRQYEKDKTRKKRDRRR